MSITKEKAISLNDVVSGSTVIHRGEKVSGTVIDEGVGF